MPDIKRSNADIKVPASRLRYGTLPEETWSSGAAEATKREYGHCRPISSALFETMWHSTKVVNQLDVS